jgi:hypothetical protein
MSKNLLKELILPAFWLFFFAVSSTTGAKVNELKKANNITPSEFGIKQQEIAPAASHAVNKNQEATFTKAIYLSKY